MKSKKNKLINSLLKITLASGLIVTTGALVLKNGEETAFENINIFNQRSEFAKIAAPTEFIYDSNTNTWSAAGSLGADYSTGSVEIVSGAEAGSEIVCETNAGITTYTISGLLYGKAYDSINLHYSVPEVSEEDIVIDPFTITETPPTISSWDYDKENSFDAIELTFTFVEN